MESKFQYLGSGRRFSFLWLQSCDVETSQRKPFAYEAEKTRLRLAAINTGPGPTPQSLVRTRNQDPTCLDNDPLTHLMSSKSVLVRVSNDSLASDAHRHG